MSAVEMIGNRAVRSHDDDTPGTVIEANSCTAVIAGEVPFSQLNCTVVADVGLPELKMNVPFPRNRPSFPIVKGIVMLVVPG